MVIIKKGNIFNTKCQTIVNTVNCSGVMGAGIAYEFRLRYPEMFLAYQKICNAKQLSIGKLWIFNLNKNKGFNKILNFPTKSYWKLPTKEEYLELGLQKFIDSYKEKEITSIAFPLLGASNGGISQDVSLNIMRHYLDNIDIPVEIWHYDPNASDDIFNDFKAKFLSLSDERIKELSGLRSNQIKSLKAALGNKYINNMNTLLTEKGIGDITLEKAFAFIQSYSTFNLLEPQQANLF